MTCRECAANKLARVVNWRCPKHLAVRKAEKRRAKDRRLAVGLPAETAGVREVHRRHNARRKARHREETKALSAALPKPPRPSSPMEIRRNHCAECGERQELGMMWCERHR